MNNLVGDVKANTGDFYMYINSQKNDTQRIPPLNQGTSGPVNAHLISWPSKAQNIQNLQNMW